MQNFTVSNSALIGLGTAAALHAWASAADTSVPEIDVGLGAGGVGMHEAVFHQTAGFPTGLPETVY